MAKKLEIKKICVIENMAGLICPYCKNEINFFGTGGGESMANAMDVYFLGRIPMEQKNRECGDAGIPILLKYPGSKTSEIFNQIAKKVHEPFEYRTYKSD